MALLTLPFNTEHPCFAGHFPERAIVPGVLLLDWAQSAMQDALGQLFQGLIEAKFHHPASPTDILELEFSPGATIVSFEIRSTTHKIASGRFALSAGFCA